MFGQTDLAAFVHDLESVLEPLRADDRAVTPGLVAGSLRAHDHISALLDGRKPDGGQAILDALSTALAEPEPLRSGWRVSFALPADTLSLGGRPELVLDELRDLGATRVQARVAGVPPLDKLDPSALYLSWVVWLPSTVSEAAIRDVFMFHDGLDLSIEPTGPEMNALPPGEMAVTSTGARLQDGSKAPGGTFPAEAEVSIRSSAVKSAAMMRVSADRLDEIMDRVGELVIAEARLSAIATTSGDPDLLSVAEEIHSLATGLRDTTMSVRMTPLGSITGRFRRLIHDLSMDLGKPVELVIEGEETELDKTVVEQLADPLLHLMRNAIDHGIEPASTREQAGKPGTGRVTLSARYSGAEVLITVMDDGRGLDSAKIRAKAIETGLLSANAELSNPEIFQLIFAPGFSTASKVTELSGRGVGMDVVKRTVSDLRGSIEVASEPGQGTRMILRLPLTLAIVDGLLVEVAGERFAIPLAAVHEIVELPEASSHEDGSPRFLIIRDRLVPYLMLRNLFSSPKRPVTRQKVVVVSAGETRVGLMVDRIVGSFQTVIKQLSPLHARIKMFSGATILGDGNVALILDVSQLIGYAQRGHVTSGDRPALELVA
jgi:two-component system chemotaxis sensor kinase CheA